MPGQSWSRRILVTLALITNSFHYKPLSCVKILYITEWFCESKMKDGKSIIYKERTEAHAEDAMAYKYLIT